MTTLAILIVVAFYKFRNETFVQFIKDILEVLNRLGSGAVGVKAVADQLAAAFDAMIAHLDPVVKSDITAKIEEQDRFRDGTLRALTTTARANLHHLDAARREAAARVTSVIDHYGSVARRTYDDESAAIDDVLRELTSATHAADVTTLGLGALVTQLSDANAKFFELMHDRYEEERPSASMHESRVVVETHLNALIARVEASVTLLGLDSNPDLAAFVEEYNRIATRYKHVLAQQQGRRDAAREKDDSSLVDEGTQTGEDGPVEE
ncbi:MAG: DUF6261 family protein [Odoribacteraceae bacterium]|jgi:hypothetical protein|nr:DUF6261 family protein [Odoribacteraceae bacterium]